jgi:hypothetical protein
VSLNLGKYQLPATLNEGAMFSGFKVESVKQTETGVVWVFSRSNHALVLAMPYDEFWDLISSKVQGEYLMDEMAGELHRQFRQASTLSTTQSNGN